MRLKTFSLTLMTVIALMALYGVSASSASILCKTNATTGGCLEPYASGQALEASLKKETAATIEVGTTVLDTCTGATIKGKATNVGSSTEPAEASVESLSWSGCTQETKTLEGGTLKFKWFAGTDDATLEVANTRWTVKTIFGSCIYGYGAEAKQLAYVTGGNPAAIKVTAEIPKLSGNCPGTSATWTAEWTVTEPKPLYFTKGEP
jgi:hypothetical protein